MMTPERLSMILTAAIALLLLVVLFTLPVHAKEAPSLCMMHDAFVQGMARPPKWNKVAQGLKFDGLLSETYASPEGQWLIAWTWPTGQTCVVDAGTGWVGFGPPRGDAF